MKTKRHKTRKAVIVSVIPNETLALGFKYGYVQIKDEKGEIHNFINGSINEVREQNRVVGLDGLIEWRTGLSYGAWFFKTKK